MPSSAPTENALPEAQRRRRKTSRRPHKLDKSKASARDAARRARKSKPNESFVAYVGNIGPDVSEDALRAHFSSCGNVLSARIHCCGGIAMTVKPPPASYVQGMKVRQYGIIVFGSNAARHRACKMGGTLAGRELTVSVVISDLPEVQEKIKRRLDDYRSRLEPPDVHRAQQSALKSLKIDPTVLLDPKYERKRRLRKPFQLMGVSLQEGII